MTISVRRATIKDSRHIVNIINRAFGEPASLEQVQHCIEQDTFRTCVAELDNHLIGFVFGFITTDMDGTKRCELDLQAVHPDYQGRGAGKKLVKHFIEDETHADYIRALIRVGNTPMEKALSRMEFSTDDEICGLYISSQTTGTASTPEIDVGASYSMPALEKLEFSDTHLIPVATMTYNGIWLEGKITAQAIHAGFSARQNEDDIVGAVVPESDKSALEALESANFDFINQYRRWQYMKTNN